MVRKREGVGGTWLNSRSATFASEAPPPLCFAFYPRRDRHLSLSLLKLTVRRGEASSARAKEPGQGAGSSSGRSRRRRARHRRARRHHAARGLSRGDAGEASCRGGSGAASRHCARVGVGKRGVNWRGIRMGKNALSSRKKVRVVSEEVRGRGLKRATARGRRGRK